MFFRILTVIIVLAAAYAAYEIYYFSSMFNAVKNPKGEFQVLEPDDFSTTMVEFMDYSCPHCHNIHPVVKEVLEKRSDIRYVAMPISVMDQPSERLVRLALAAGLQGKFWEFHDAFLESPILLDGDDAAIDAFVEETAMLYGIDYTKLVEDSIGKEVDQLFEKNMKAASKATIYSTPYFIIGKTFYQPQEDPPETATILRVINDSTQ